MTRDTKQACLKFRLMPMLCVPNIKIHVNDVTQNIDDYVEFSKCRNQGLYILWDGFARQICKLRIIFHTNVV